MSIVTVYVHERRGNTVAPLRGRRYTVALAPGRAQDTCRRSLRGNPGGRGPIARHRLFRDAARDIDGQRDGAGVLAGVHNLLHLSTHLDAARLEGLNHLVEEEGREAVDGARTGHDARQISGRYINC